MTSAVALARLRSIIDETTAGKFSDTNDLYPYLDLGHNHPIQLGLSKEQMIPGYRSPLLLPLITLDPLNTTTVGAAYQEYNLPSDFIKIYQANYAASGVAPLYGCGIVDFNQAVKRSGNTYMNSTTSPVVYTRAEKLGFFPQPSGGAANMYAHYYYKSPTLVASGVEFTLREETHEAILMFAVHYALSKDADERAMEYYQKGINLIERLL